MTEYEILALVGVHVDQIDAAFEFWLTVSFGVLVAVHIAQSSMARQLKILLCALYVSSALIAIFHTIGDFTQAVEHMERVQLASSANYWNLMGGILRMTVYLVGTVSVSVAIFRYDTWVKKTYT